MPEVSVQPTVVRNPARTAWAVATAGLAVLTVLCFIGASMLGSDAAIDFACTPYYPGCDLDHMALVGLIVVVGGFLGFLAVISLVVWLTRDKTKTRWEPQVVSAASDDA